MNFAQIYQECLNYGFADGPQVNTSRIKNWINEAQHRVARQVEAPEFQQAATIITVAGTNSYALPSDFLRAQDVAFPQLTMRLRWIDLQELDTTNPAEVLGPPAMYALYQSNILLFPSPNAVYNLTLRYIQNPPDLVADSDVPALNANYHDLLITYAVTKAFEGEDDYEAAQYFFGKWQRDLAAYATDVQGREVDRPRQVDGMWMGTSYGGRGVV